MFRRPQRVQDSPHVRLFGGSSGTTIRCLPMLARFPWEIGLGLVCLGCFVPETSAPRAAISAERGVSPRSSSSQSPARGVAPVASILLSLKPAFARCYDAELKHSPGRRGTIRLTIRVGASGEVSEVEANSEGDLVETIGCAKTVARGAKFPPPEGGYAVTTVPVPFVLSSP